MEAVDAANTWIWQNMGQPSKWIRERNISCLNIDGIDGRHVSFSMVSSQLI